MTCPSCYLTADGRILGCGLTYPTHGQWGDPDADRHGIRNEHDGAWDALWLDSDPCAWDSTCPDCDGTTRVGGDLTYGEHRIGTFSRPCGTCDGAEPVDTVPTRLIGVGSVVGKSNDVDARFIVTHVTSDGCWAVVNLNDDRDGLIIAPSVQRWYPLVRAVPPAHNRPVITQRWSCEPDGRPAGPTARPTDSRGLDGDRETNG